MYVTGVGKERNTKKMKLTETEKMINAWLHKLSLEPDNFIMDVRQLEIVFRTLKQKVEEDKKRKWLK